MPFTLAHPGAVLFLKNRRLSLTALVVGSMAPDFIYFLNLRPYGNLGHTTLGFFILNLPLCFIVSYLFHNVIKAPLIRHLPSPLDDYYFYLVKDRFKITSLREIIIFIYSAILGMITHVIWDGFTHHSGFFVKNIPYLRENIRLLGVGEIYRYKIFQHGSTLLGFIIVIFFLYNLRGKSINSIKFKKNFKEKLTYYLVVIIACILVILFSFFLFYFLNINYGIGSFIVSTINGVILGILVASLKYKK